MIAVNGQDPRLDGSLVTMIHIFEEMFGREFWGQTAIVFTRLSMDGKSIRKRKKNYKETDDELARGYLNHLERKFPDGRGLKYLILDALYDDEDDDEKDKFDNGMEQLWDMIASAPDLPTDKVKKVETKHKQLEILVEEMEKKLEIMNEKDQKLNDALRTMEREREKIKKELKDKEKEIREVKKESTKQIEEMVLKLQKEKEEKERELSEVNDKIRRLMDDAQELQKEKMAKDLSAQAESFLNPSAEDITKAAQLVRSRYLHELKNVDLANLQPDQDDLETFLSVCTERLTVNNITGCSVMNFVKSNQLVVECQNLSQQEVIDLVHAMKNNIKYVRLKDTASLDSVTLEKCLLGLEDQETKCSKLILPNLLEEKLDKLKLRLKLKNISIRTQRDEEENIMKSEASKIFTYGYSAGYSPKNLVDVSYVAKLIRSKYLTNVKKIQIQNLSLFRKKDEDDLEKLLSVCTDHLTINNVTVQRGSNLMKHIKSKELLLVNQTIDNDEVSGLY